MKQTIKPSERINSILDQEDITPNRLANTLGISPGSLYNILSGKTKVISGNLARKIRKVYPHYNLTWLTEGIGEMGAAKNDENISNTSNYFKGVLKELAQIDDQEKELSIVEVLEETRIINAKIQSIRKEMQEMKIILKSVLNKLEQQNKKDLTG